MSPKPKDDDELWLEMAKMSEAPIEKPLTEREIETIKCLQDMEKKNAERGDVFKRLKETTEKLIGRFDNLISEAVKEKLPWDEQHEVELAHEADSSDDCDNDEEEGEEIEDAEEPKRAKRIPKPKVPYSPSDFGTTKGNKNAFKSADEFDIQDPVPNPSLRGTTKRRGSRSAGRLRGRGRGRGKY